MMHNVHVSFMIISNIPFSTQKIAGIIPPSTGHQQQTVKDVIVSIYMYLLCHQVVHISMLAL